MLALLFVSLFSTAAAQTISPDRLFGRYRQFTWQDQHGLPQNGISAIVQTPDGYLWLAIAEGVARFDGVNFTAFDTGNTPAIKSNNVQALAVGRDGTLWIGTHGGGLTKYRDGEFQNVTTGDGLSDSHVRGLFEDSRGALWIGTDGGGANLLKDGRLTVLRDTDGLPDNRVRCFAEDRDGAVWIGTVGGLARYADGRVTSFVDAGSPRGRSIEAMLTDSSGQIWFGGASGLARRQPDGSFVAVGDADGIADVQIQSIAEDRDGTIWIGTVDNGIYRHRDGQFENLTTGDGLVGDDIQAIHCDAAGDIWLGSSGNGLAQLHRGRITMIDRSDGLPGEMIGALFEDSDGAVWIGTDEGLARFENNQLTTVRGADGHSLRGVSRIAEDPMGRLWLSGFGVGDYRKTTGDLDLKPADFNGPVSAVLHDRRGRTWLGTNFDGVHLRHGDASETHIQKADGLADDFITCLFEDRAGGVWIGTRNGLSRFADEKLTTFSAADGFSGRHVLSFHEDLRGNIWIGTDGDGLFRFRDGRFGVVTTRVGLYDNLAFSILEDDAGNLWMSGNKGIYRASLDELESYLDGGRAFVSSFSYGVADGMLSRECNGASPAGIRTRDGRLWFPTVRGVAVVDPLMIKTEPPLVHLEKIFVDDRVVDAGKIVEMRPTDENLEVRFGATSWNRPAQVRFRYRLAGLDADWVDAGTRRVAYYPHIAPGEYTFEVVADNGEGVWSLPSQQFRIRVYPPFYQTWWFWLICAIAIALTIRLIYQYRVRQLRRLNEVREKFTRQLIEYQESERKRIAAELHDSIGQNLIVIRNRALMTLGTDAEPVKMVEQLKEISSSAADSIREIRQIAHNLHPYQLEHLGLKTALESMIEQAGETSATAFSVAIDDVDDQLSKEAEINFYRIVQESVSNILKHSNATEATVKIARTNGGIELLVSDNGRGFVVVDAGPRGLGLAGIAERARMLNAVFSLRSEPSNGTTIEVKISHE